MPATVYWRALPHTPQRGERDAFLSEALGEARFLQLRKDGRGKPYLLHCAKEPHPPQLSIAHTHGWIGVAVSDRAVGLDAERADRAVAECLASRILSASERVCFASMETSARQRYLRTRFVIKEAFLKYTGEGLAGGMHTLTASDGRVGRAEGPVIPYVLVEIGGCTVAVAGAEDATVGTELIKI